MHRPLMRRVLYHLANDPERVPYKFKKLLFIRGVRTRDRLFRKQMLYQLSEYVSLLGGDTAPEKRI